MGDPAGSASPSPRRTRALPRVRFLLLPLLVLALVAGPAGLDRCRVQPPALIFSGFTNSPAVLDRFVTLPSNTRVAVFCLTNPGPGRVLVRGDVIRETKTNRVAEFQSTVAHDYISGNWLYPGGSDWILIPEPAGAAAWRLTVPLTRPAPDWLRRQQSLLNSLGVWRYIRTWQEPRISSEILAIARTNLPANASRRSR